MDKAPKEIGGLIKSPASASWSIQGLKRQKIYNRYTENIIVPFTLVLASLTNKWPICTRIVLRPFCFSNSSNTHPCFPGIAIPFLDFTPWFLLQNPGSWFCYPSFDSPLLKDMILSLISPAWHITILRHQLKFVRSAQAWLALLPLLTPG